MVVSYFLGCLYLNLLEELSQTSLHCMYRDISNFTLITRSVAFEFKENQPGRIAVVKSNLISLTGVINSFSLPIHSLWKFGNGHDVMTSNPYKGFTVA